MGRGQDAAWGDQALERWWLPRRGRAPWPASPAQQAVAVHTCHPSTPKPPLPMSPSCPVPGTTLAGRDSWVSSSCRAGLEPARTEGHTSHYSHWHSLIKARARTHTHTHTHRVKIEGSVPGTACCQTTGRTGRVCFWGLDLVTASAALPWCLRNLPEMPHFPAPLGNSFKKSVFKFKNSVFKFKNLYIYIYIYVYIYIYIFFFF